MFKEMANSSIIQLFLIISISMKIAIHNTIISDKSPLLVIYYITPIIFLITILFYTASNQQKIIAIILHISTTCILAMSLLYYNYFHIPLHFTNIIAQINEGIDTSTRFIGFFKPNILVLIIDFPALILFLTKPITKVNSKWTLTSLISLIIITTYKEYTANPKEYRIINQIKNYTTLESIQTKRHYGEEIFTYNTKKYSWFTANIIEISLSRFNEYKYIQQLNTSPQKKETPGKDIKRSVIIIQVESMGGNIIEKKWKNRDVTPFLKKISRQGIYKNIMSYHLAGGTSDAEFSIINSIEPLQNYPAIKINGYTYPNSLAKFFKDNSYSTLAFHGNDGNYYFRKKAFAAMKFDKFYDRNIINIPQHQAPEWGLRDHEVFNFATRTINNLAKETNYLAYIITMTSHGPFNFTDNFYTNQDFNTIKNKNIANYYKSMHYVDESIERFISETTKNDQNTIFIILGDHSPGLPNNEYYKNSAEQTQWGYIEFVPVIIFGKDIKPNQNTNTAYSFLDIAPTAIELSGIATTQQTFGCSMIGPPCNETIPFQGANIPRDSLQQILKVN